MPADARAGFELFMEAAKKVKDDASADDLQAIGSDLTDDDTKKVQALFTYVATTRSDLPTPDLPSTS